MQQTVDYTIHHDLVAHPWRGPDNTAGLVGGQGCLPESLVFRHHKPMIAEPPPSTAPVTERIGHRVIFGGYFLPHFGHFLLESLARLWVCRLFPDTPIVWLRGRNTFSAWQSTLLAHLGVNNPHIFINRVPTLLSEVILPSAGYATGQTFAAEHADFLGVFDAQPAQPPTKLWLSRSKVVKRKFSAGVANEQALDAELERRGWLIYHPQEHSIDEQIQALGSASRIAGIEGSAFHLLVMFKRLDTRIDLIARRGRISANYLDVARRKNLNQREHYVGIDIVEDADGNKERRLSSIPAVISLLEAA